MVYAFIADGFEELELVAPVDMLRRAGVEVALVGVTGNLVTSARKITIKADISLEQVKLDQAEAIFLPGGGQGVKNLSASADVKKAITFAAEKGILITAICAAPSILGDMGLLKGKTFTCYPGFETSSQGNFTGKSIEIDKNIITAKGAGVSILFGHAIVTALKGKAVADKIYRDMQCE